VQVTFAVASGGGSVSGATPSTNGSGIATVGSWTLGPTAGTNNNTLTATASGSGISGNPVTFTASATAGAPTQIVITTQPSASAQAGVAFSTQPVVQLKDAGGNDSPTAGRVITATVASGPGNSLSNATATTNGSGVATFSGLSIDDVAGSYTLSFDNGALTGATSNTITLSAGPTAKLTFTTQPPVLTTVGTQFTVVVAVSDGFGNPTDANVQMALNQDTGASLGGTLDVASTGGSATFSDLSVDQPTGLNPYTLTASASATSAAPVQSNGFFVGP
jgi:adhesin/invasin